MQPKSIQGVVATEPKPTLGKITSIPIPEIISVEALAELARARINESILLIGNGPSTKQLVEYGLHNLPNNLDTFGMGAAYRFYKEVNWWPDYFAWCDTKVVHCHREDFRVLVDSSETTVKQFFFSLPISKSKKMTLVPHSSTGDFCFETAAKLGYKNIFIIGVEGNYVEELPDSRRLTEEEYSLLGFDEIFPYFARNAKNIERVKAGFKENLRIINRTPAFNPNYFFDSYQRAGDVYSLPRSHTHQNNWKKKAQEYHQIQVYNLSPNSVIDDFEKINFDRFLELVVDAAPSITLVGQRVAIPRLDSPAFGGSAESASLEAPGTEPAACSSGIVSEGVGPSAIQSAASQMGDGERDCSANPVSPKVPSPSASPKALSRKSVSSSVSTLAAPAPDEGGPVAPKVQMQFTPPQPPLRRPWYASFGDSVRVHVPALFPVLRAARRSVWRLAKASPVWIAAAGGMAAMGFMAYGPGPVSGRLVLAAGGLAGALVLALVALSWRLRRAIQTLSAQNRQLDEKIAYIHELAAGREERVDRLLDDHKRLAEACRVDQAHIIDTLRTELQLAEARLKAADGKGVSSLRSEQERITKSLRTELEQAEARLKAVDEEAVASMRDAQAHLEALQQRLNAVLEEQARLLERAGEQAATHDKKLREELEAAIAQLNGEIEGLETRHKDQAAEISQALEARLEELQQRLESMKQTAEQNLQSVMKEIIERLSAVEEVAQNADSKADTGETDLTAVREELQAAMKALREGLEQRLRAEVDDFAKDTTAALISRLDQLQDAQIKGDEKFDASLSALKELLENELKPEVGSVREIAEAAQSAIPNLKKAKQKLDVEHARIRERIEAGERQIGLIRYPDAPDVFAFFGHHKCASRFFRDEVFGRIIESTGARVRRYEIKDPPFHFSRLDELDLIHVDFKGLGKSGKDVVLFSNASQRGLNKFKRNAGDWKGLRIIRDPRQVLVSNYFHHKSDHPVEAMVGWVWDQLVKDKPILRELPEEDGILHELDNISKQVIEDQILAPFDDERIMTIRLEDFSQDPRGHLLQISQFLKVPDVAGIDFGNTKANPDSAPWHKHFTSEIRERFKERYGQALIDLGYEEDMDW